MRRWLITTVATAVIGFIVKRVTERNEQRKGTGRARRR